jgi:hypothetical protein
MGLAVFTKADEKAEALRPALARFGLAQCEHL